MDLLYNQHFCFQCFDIAVCFIFLGFKAKPTLLCKYIQLQVQGKREINNYCPSELVSKHGVKSGRRGKKYILHWEIVGALLRSDRWNVWGHYDCQHRRGFEDVTSHHKKVRQEHQRGEANHSASVFFLPPASLSCQHLWASLTHPPSKSYVCDDSIFICNQKHFILVGLIVGFYSLP